MMPDDLTPASYDYSSLSPALATRLQQRVGRVRERLTVAAEAIVAIGRELIAAKDELPHGEFGPWLLAEFGMSDRTARNYMRVAESFKTETVSDLPIAARALYLLAGGDVPEEAREEAIERAQDGEQIGHKQAQEIKQRHTSERPQNSQTAAHSEAEASETEPTLDRAPQTPQNPAHRLTDNATVDADDDDDPTLDDLAVAPSCYPDDLAGVQAQLEQEGYRQRAISDTRLTFEHPTTGAVVRVVKPPEPGKLKVRVVAHRDDDWSDVTERLALAGVELNSPTGGHLPKYPETQRAYGTLDLNTHQLDQVASLQAELAKAQAAQRQVMDILHEYQEQITRAQKYKPTSDRGEAVSPLLRALERVALTIQDAERKGREKA
jgi:hypothetical protein